MKAPCSKWTHLSKGHAGVVLIRFDKNLPKPVDDFSVENFVGAVRPPREAVVEERIQIGTGVVEVVSVEVLGFVIVERGQFKSIFFADLHIWSLFESHTLFEKLRSVRSL